MVVRIRAENKGDFEFIFDFVEEVFRGTDYSDGMLERKIVSEIRESKYYVPELSMVAENENGEIVGHFMLSKFPIEGKHEDKVLLLAPVAVSTKCQKQGIGTIMLNHGINAAKEMGFAGIIVEGSPKYYNRFGFVKSTNYNLIASKGIPAEALMAMELYDGGLSGIEGKVNFSIYKCLA